MVEEGTKAIRRVALLLAAGLLAAGCSGGDADPTTTTSPTTTSTTSTTTTSTTTTSTTSTTTSTTTTTTADTTTTVDPQARPEVVVSNMNRDSVDDFDPTGDDLYHVAIELVDLFNYLEGNPTGTGEEMAALMYEPDYRSWDNIVEGFDELADNSGWHYADAGIRILAIEVVEVSGDTAVVALAQDRDIQLIRDADDVVVREYQGWEPEVIVFTYRRGDDGRWLIADWEARSATEDGIASMVPVEWTGRQR